MITPVCRFTYVQVFEPKANLSGVLKYSAGLMFPKDDKVGVAAVKKAVDNAIATGVAKGKFNEAQTKSQSFRYPLRDGDQYYAEAADDDAKAARSGFRGMMFITASNNGPIGVVDEYTNPIMDPNELYSGCWGRADVNFFPFNRGGGVGIGVGLNNIMKTKDDERLDGKQSAANAFASVAKHAE